MKIIIDCEESQAVTRAFVLKGHDAYSCDLQQCSGDMPERHIKGDCLANDGVYQFRGAHPTCTYLSNSSIGHLVRMTVCSGFIWNESIKRFYNPERWNKMIDAVYFFKDIYRRVKETGMGYIENPIMHPYAMELIGIKPTQIIQPYHFGHMERKATCLWLVGLKDLTPTENVYDAMMKLPKNVRERLQYLPPSKDRAKIRSKTFPGIARAMAEQWG
jgi:hypothetical protein